MSPERSSVAVLGAGPAGLAAADTLARHGIAVDLIEKSTRPGGHAVQLTCKATSACVTCGACLVSDFLRRTAGSPDIRWHLNQAVQNIRSGQTFSLHLEAAGRHTPIDAAAILIAIGFQVYDASAKPYGYGRLANVLTNLDLERRLKQHARIERPSDGTPPRSIAFIQCVGSRDARLNHLWCSRFCCASALRMARRIRHLHPETEVTVFYIDIQTFGKDFQTAYAQMRQELRFIRAIPGDIVAAEADGCAVNYFDPDSGKARETVFDLVVLSTGMTPSPDHARLAKLLDWPLAAHGFFPEEGRPDGVFCAGAAQGPMTIAESVASGTRAAWRIIEYLRERGRKI